MSSRPIFLEQQLPCGSHFVPKGTSAGSEDMIVVTRGETFLAAAHNAMHGTAKNSPSPKCQQHMVEQLDSWVRGETPGRRLWWWCIKAKLCADTSTPYLRPEMGLSSINMMMILVIIPETISPASFLPGLLHLNNGTTNPCPCLKVTLGSLPFTPFPMIPLTCWLCQSKVYPKPTAAQGTALSLDLTIQQSLSWLFLPHLASLRFNLQRDAKVIF